MKRQIINLLCLILCPIFLAGCSATGDSPTGGGSSIGLSAAASATGPVITPAASMLGSSGLQPFEANWQTGYVVYAIYGLIQEYVDSRDNGVIDGSNMYKAMHDAETYFNNGVDSCTTMTAQTVTSPFDFGTEDLGDEYDCIYNNTSGNYTYSIATNTSAQPMRALIGTSVVETGQTTRTVYQVQYNETTKDLTVLSAYLVDYDDQDDYSVRIYISGNETTGLFTLKLVKTGGLTNAISISGYGYGYSTGSQYYLFKVSTNNFSGTNVTGTYYCFESSTTETEMKALDDAGVDSGSIPANCSTYEANLPSTDYLTDQSDSPTLTTDFTGTGDYGIGLTTN